MSTSRGYISEPFRYEFDAHVVGTVDLPDGRYGVLLEKTYFYPTGGGQDHDTGTLGDANVIDVFPDEQDRVVHVLDRPVVGTGLPAHIDVARRIGFTQHHSAQHLLSAAVDQSLGLETLSAHISIDSPSTIDVPSTRLSEADLFPAENLANEVIFEDRLIKSYFVTDAEAASVPFRKPPKVSGTLRVVEIEGFDYSACGGTHCTRSGMIGIVKVLKAERRGDLTRIHFVAGQRALEYFQNYHAVLGRAGQLLSTGPDGLVAAIERLQEAQRAAQKELQGLEAERMRLQAYQLVATAEMVDGIRLVTASYRDRTQQQVRALAMLLQNEPGVVAVLAAHDGTRLALAVACAPDTGISANELIRKQLVEFGGRGGGDARVAQGGAATTDSPFASIFANTREYVHDLVSGVKDVDESH